MEKRFWAIIGVIIAVFVGIIVLNNNEEKDNGADNSDGKPTSHIKGNTDAKVKLVEYGDYQCPFCGVFHPITKQVIEKYGDKISFQYRHFPLIEIHQNALAAARSAEAAGKQDKFWEMHDLIFTNQGAWSNSNKPAAIFEGYAKQLGLDIEQFKEDVASRAANSAINADKAEFNKTKLPASTPTFLINGKQVKPEASLESFSKIIDKALEENK
jgi:protein-disulfide isomerase